MPKPNRALHRRRVAKVRKLGFTGSALEVAGKISSGAPAKIRAFEKKTGFVPDWGRVVAFSGGHLFPREKRMNAEEFGYCHSFRKETLGGVKSFTVNFVVNKRGKVRVTAVDTSGNKWETRSISRIRGPEIREAIKAYIQILGIK